MSDSSVKKNGRKILILFAVLAVLVAAACMDGYVFSPFRFSMPCSGVSWACSNGQGATAITDYDAGLMFMNSRGQLVKYSSGNSLFSSTSVNHFLTAIYGDSVWVLDGERLNEDWFLNGERIVRCALDGKELNTVFTLKHDNADEDDCFVEPTVMDIRVDSDGGFILQKGRHGSLRLLAFDPYKMSETTEVYEMHPDGDAPEILVAGYYKERNLIIYSDTMRDVYRLEIGTDAPELLYRDDTGAEIYDFSIGEDGRIASVYGYDLEGAEIPFSFGFAVKNILFELSVCFLAVCTVIWIVSYLRRAVREKRYESLKRTLYIAGAIAGCVALVVFYSNALVRQANSNSNISVATEAALIREEIQGRAIPLLKAYRHGESMDSDSRDEIDTILNRKIFLAHQNGEKYSIILTGLDDSDWPGFIAGGYDTLSLGSYIDYKTYEFTGINEVSDVTIGESSNLWGYYTVADADITDGEEVLGTVTVVKDRTMFMLARNRDNILLIIGLVSATIGLVFLLTEFKAWFESFRRYNESRAAGSGHPEFWLQRPMLFFSMAATTADLSLCVLIGKDMLSAGGREISSLTASVPEVLGTLGMFAGVALYGVLSRRFSSRKLAVFFFTVGVLSYAAMVLSVEINSFLLFSIMEFLSTLGVVAGESYIVQLALLAPDENSRMDANNGHNMVKISGGGLSGLASGYIAQYMGNGWVYIFAGVLVLVETVLLLTLFRGVKDDDCAEETAGVQTAASKKGGVFSLLASGPMLLLIFCVILPENLVAVYKSFLFPLFADARGVEKSIISAVSAIVNVVCIAAMKPVSRAVKEGGFARSAALASLMTAVGFLMFLITDSMLWIIAMLFITRLIASSETICWKMLWPSITEKAGVDRKSGDTFVRIVDSAMSTAKSPVAGAFLNLGQSALCIFIAAYCSVSAFIYRFQRGKKTDAGTSA